jgi:hypothetical protein
MKKNLLISLILLIFAVSCSNPFLPEKRGVEPDTTPAFNIKIVMIGVEEGDSVTAQPNAGNCGDIIILHYTVVSKAVNNTLSFSGVNADIPDVTSASIGTRAYTINAGDADYGEITIIATFTHTNLTLDPIAFEDTSGHITITYGDNNNTFTNVITEAHAGSGNITYTSDNTEIATVSDNGKVTILKVGSVIITAYKAADEVYSYSSVSYVLGIEQKTITIEGVTAVDRVFSDGNTSVVLNGGVLQGVLDDDDVAFTLGTGTIFNANTGENKPVTVFITLTGLDASNYKLTQPDDITVTINNPVGSAVSKPVVSGTPTLNRITVNAVTLDTATGQEIEYAIMQENDAMPTEWQTGTTFTGLASNTTYYVYARSKANDSYNAGTSNVSDSINTATLLLTIPEVVDYLADATGGALIDDPVYLPVALEGGLGVMTNVGSGWRLLLDAIQAAGKFVELDLSACEMDGTVFNPDSNIATGKNRIVSIVLPDAAESIVDGLSTRAFLNFSNLKTVSADNVLSIGQSAFSNCTSLTTVSFPAATSIGREAFLGCTSLTTMSFPAVISIGLDAFFGCTSLTSVSLPAVTIIGGYAFQGCISLTSVSFPATTNLSDNPFIRCNSLASFVLTGSGDLEVLENGRALVRNITGGKELIAYPTASGSVEMHEITIIGNDALRGCTSLTTVSFPVITSIGSQSFWDCTSLVSVSFPAATSIGRGAFVNTGTHSFTIILGTNTPTLDTSIFSNVTRTVNVLVPQGATGYSPFTGTLVTVSGADANVNWANGLRGRGWNGLAFGSGSLQQGITVIIQHAP